MTAAPSDAGRGIWAFLSCRFGSCGFVVAFGSAAAPSSLFSAEGATIVAMVKSRSVIAARRARGQLHVADVDRIADFEAGDVDLDVVGDLVRIADQFEFVAHDVEHAAALQARARRLR